MGDYIVLGIVAIVLIAVIIYIIRQKKKGARCIGCPSGCKACANSKNKSECCCGCNTQQSEE